MILAGEVLVDWVRSPDAVGLATALASEMLGRHPGPLHHFCPECGSIEHGRPSFDAPVEVSVAHATALSAVAVSTMGAVGIDLEPNGRTDLDFVRAEAVGKARGVGLTRASAGETRSTVVAIPGHLAVVAVLGQRAPVVRMRRRGPAAPVGPASGGTNAATSLRRSLQSKR